MLSIFLLISVLFIAGLVYNQRSKKTICAICAGIALTWLLLFILYKTDAYKDVVLLSLLMGQSVTGLYYYGIRHVPKALRLFTLPYFLSLTAILYFAVTGKLVTAAILFVAALWVFAWLVFTNRNDPGKKPLVRAAVNCCEDS